jgi:hypothetical protein
MLHINLHILHAHEVISRKTEFLCSLCKKGKIDARMILYMVLFFILFAHPIKMSISHETVCAHKE